MDLNLNPNMNLIKPILSILILGVLVSGCDLLSDPDKDEKADNLYVKFYNNESSEYTITNIQLMTMGQAGEETSSPSGEWSDNILEDNQTVEPGEYVFFNLDIPNLHYCEYRLGVDTGDGAEVMLHLQDGYSEDSPPTITHWGGDDRTVRVTVVRNDYSGLIEINGWSDWVGID